MRSSLPVLLYLVAAFCGPTRAATTFSVPSSVLPNPMVFIAYGDTRFTDRRETEASSPAARQALVAKIAAENPAALFINGDLPWHGVAEDYEVYLTETRSWRHG